MSIGRAPLYSLEASIEVAAVQTLQLVIFAALAVVVLWQLYAVLGRRVGRQPGDQAKVDAPARPAERLTAETEDAGPPSGAEALRRLDPSFDPEHFLSGARQAYEMIVLAFAAGDRERLRPLLETDVYDGFDTAIRAREDEGRTESVEFLHQPRADLEDVEVSGGAATARVRFLAEFRSRSTGPEGEAVDDRRVAELWTFGREVGSADPNWRLARVEPADA